jgi:hypothetical protein
MKHTDYEFTFEGFNFMATFKLYPNGVSVTELLLESNIDDELIPVTDLQRIYLIENHLAEKFKAEIEEMQEMDELDIDDMKYHEQNS